ncbi:MAG TPA: cation:proton antiporter, partial [Nitriliruptorales bacterium]|nr:cation:proton antiporter [Nitriliruptorales bacterium]
AGTNDLIVLPAVLVLAAVASGGAGSPGGWAWFLVQLFLIGPAVGAAVGAGGAWAMSRVDVRTQVRSEYQALYGLGLVLAAFAGGEWLGADGFLAAFAAGMAVTATNNRLCDCFMEFGEVVAEMLMLLAFVLFGAVLSELAPPALTVPTLALAAITILVARPATVFALLSLRHTALSRPARAFIAWFGPRGLNSLLLALLVVRIGVPQAEQLFVAVGVVVMASVLLHGVSATPVTAWYAHRVEATTLPEEREATARGLLHPEHSGEVPRVAPEELAALLASPHPPQVVDVRTRSTAGDEGIPGAMPVRADEIDRWAEDQTRERLVVLYCT